MVVLYRTAQQRSTHWSYYWYVLVLSIEGSNDRNGTLQVNSIYISFRDVWPEVLRGLEQMDGLHRATFQPPASAASPDSPTFPPQPQPQPSHEFSTIFSAAVWAVSSLGLRLLQVFMHVAINWRLLLDLWLLAPSGVPNIETVINIATFAGLTCTRSWEISLMEIIAFDYFSN